MRILALLLFLLTGCGCVGVPTHDAHSATLRADFNNGVCSATAVGSQTVLIATHCLKDGGKLEKISGRDAKILARTDDGKDHSLIRLNIGFDHWLMFGPYPAIGQDVFYYGNPLGIPDMLRKGYISGFVDGEFLIDVEGAPGDSGAAVLDGEGRIIGVVSMMFQGGPINFRMMGIFPMAFTQKQLEAIA